MKLLTKALAFTTVALSLSGLAMADTNTTKSKMENNTTNTAATAAPTQEEVTQALSVIAQGLYGQLSQELGLNQDELKIVAADFAKLANGERLSIPDQAVFNKVLKYISERHQKEVLSAMSKAVTENTAKGKAEFEKFSKEKGVVVKDGVAVQEVSLKTTGPVVKDGDTVDLIYTGTDVEGKVFDSNEAAGKPTPFPLNGIIPGLKNALIGYHVGSKLKILIPADQAYGDQGVPGVIQPGSYLYFTVTIEDIADAAKEKK